MDHLSSRWLQQYQHQKRNELLREFLVVALYRAERFEEAREVLANNLYDILKTQNFATGYFLI